MVRREINRASKENPNVVGTETFRSSDLLYPQLYEPQWFVAVSFSERNSNTFVFYVPRKAIELPSS